MRYRYAIPLFLALTIGLIADLGHRIKDLSVGAKAQASGAGERVDATGVCRPLGVQFEAVAERIGVNPSARQRPSKSHDDGSTPSGFTIDPKEMAGDSPDPKDMKEMLTADDAQPQAPLAFPAGGTYGMPNLGSPHSRIPTSPVAVPEPSTYLSLSAGLICFLLAKGWK